MKKIRLVLAALIFLISLSLLIWASFPIPTETLNLLIPTQASITIPGIPEQRHLTLEFPSKIRAGNSDLVRLILEADDLGNIAPTAEFDGKVVEIADLFETYHIIAEAKMDMVGVQIVPTELISEPFLGGESVTFYWSVCPGNAGEYDGRVWLYLRFVPKDGGAEMMRTISSQLVEIKVTTFLGLKAAPARTAGAIGSFLGIILAFPYVDDAFKWLWKRFKK